MNHSIAYLLKRIAVTLSVWFLVGGVSDAQPAVLALRGAAIESGGKAGRLENGVILLKGDTIQAVGKDLKIPDNARVLDVRGKTIWPGLIDPYHVITTGSNATPATRTITIRGRTYNVRSSSSTSSATFLRIVDSFDPHGAAFRPLARSGITAANLVAAGYGQSTLSRILINDPARLVANGEGLLYASVTNNSTSLGILRKGLAAGAASSSSSSSSSSRLSAVEQTLWKEIVAGKRPLLVNASNSAAILHVLKLLKPHDQAQLMLVANGPNVYETLDSLQGRNVSLVLSPAIDTAPHSQDRICVPRLLHEAGITFAISLSVSQSSLNGSQDAPLVPIAFLVKAGLPREVALAALTSVPAQLLGISKTHGSIEPQKLANLLVFDGDPLDPGSRLVRVIVEGRTVHED